MKKALIFVLAVVATGCNDKTADMKVKATTAKVYPLNADERALASANAKTYFEREWINAANARGQFTMCRPSDSNFNGMVSCFGLVPQPTTGQTYKEVKMYCGYQPTLVGCSNEDTVN
jgi:hypothetical protein